MLESKFCSGIQPCFGVIKKKEKRRFYLEISHLLESTLEIVLILAKKFLIDFHYHSLMPKGVSERLKSWFTLQTCRGGRSTWREEAGAGGSRWSPSFSRGPG